MKLLKKQKKNSITIRSVSIFWLLIYLLNGVFFKVNTNKFTLNSIIEKDLNIFNYYNSYNNRAILNMLMPFETELTGKYNYEIKNDKPCVMRYESFEQVDENTYNVKFDDGVTIENRYTFDENKYECKNDLTISTNSDSVHIGIYKEYSPKCATISNFIQKVISENEYSVYYVNTTDEKNNFLNLNTMAVVIFKDGKINVLDEKQFTENVDNEKDRRLKKIKKIIMKNEIINFFDSNMFATAFKGLNKLDDEKEMLSMIIRDYKNEDEAPINLKNYRADRLDYYNEEAYYYNEDINLEDKFDNSLSEVSFLQGDRINIVNTSYLLKNKKPEEIIEIYKDEKITKKGSSYCFKDMIFSYNKVNPSQLMEIVMKSPKLYFNEIQVIGSSFNKLENYIKSNPYNIYTASLDGKLITVVETLNSWSLIVDSDGIIKSAIYHTKAYSTSDYLRNYNNTSYNNIELYDYEIKDFPLD